MKAKESRLLDFLKSSKQFVIPIYQRPYRWEETQCRKLWDDLLRAAEDGPSTTHFVGSVVYIQDGLYSVSDNPALLLIDGQQRMTTFMLLIEALARALGDEEIDGDFSAPKLRGYYLKDPLQTGDRAYKMLLSATDNLTLQSLIDRKPMPCDYSIRLKENFELFGTLMEGANLSAICRGLNGILVVDISLERGFDNPQLIFESLNSTGKELGQADLIRNFVLMGLPAEQQTELYRDHWRPMEQAFGQEAYADHFDRFMRHYLTLRTGNIPNEKDVYETFKLFARDGASKGTSTAKLVAEIHRYAGFYCRIALGAGEPEKALADALQDIRELKAEVTFPFLLELYADRTAGLLSENELLSVLRLVEAYVFRRVVCGQPSNSHNKTFSTFGRSLQKACYLDSVRAHLLNLTSYREFPSNLEFRKALETRDLYKFRNRSYLLRRLENHGRKERVAVEEYTIEHILPQNDNLSEAWKEALGQDWIRVREVYLHTLGNLTLTGYNPEMSDKPFPAKRDISGGFKESPLQLNKGLGMLDTWDEAAIRDRANRLSELASQVWACPALDNPTLISSQMKKKDYQLITIDNHSQLTGGPVRALFDALRQNVLGLDDAVVEAFLKSYVTYRTEETFLTIIPHSSKLKLCLNLPFADIQDRRDICRNVSLVRHWGSGEVELDFVKLDDLSYIMGLVRQAYEWRLDAPGSD